MTIISDELLAAYHRLFEVCWNETATVDIGMDGYNGISYDDDSKIEDACAAIQDLLKPGWESK